ncbi:MAG: hypothetical protein IIB43_01860 [Candidatus Marinimicrobia bacterium]|nr:hypothetical protein [Candidatus Neomarinimicrobiota bacterium]
MSRRLAEAVRNRLGIFVSLGCGALLCLLVTGGENPVLLVLSLTIYLFTALVLLKNAGGFTMTPALMFYLLFTILIFISGLGFFFTDGVESIYGGGVRNYTFYLAMHGGILTLALGTIMATISFNFRPTLELLRFRDLTWDDYHREPGHIITLVLLGILALSATAFFIQQRGFIPIIEILRAQGQSNLYELAGQTRALFSRFGKGAGTYLYGGYFQQFYLVILPFLTLVIAAKYLHQRKKILLLLWLVAGIVSGFFLVMSLQRWPLMFFIILNYVLYTSYSSRIKIAHSIFFILVALSLFGLLTYIRGITEFEVLLVWLKNRIFRTQSEAFYAIFEMFPDHFAFFGGRGILSDIKGLLPGPDIAFASWMYDSLYRVYGNGTAPTIFWGQLYADFNLAGVWIGSLGVGFIMQSIHIAFLRSRKILLHLVIYAMVTMAMAELAVSNLMSAIFQFGMVTLLLLVLSLNIGSWIFSTRVLATVEAQGNP